MDDTHKQTVETIINTLISIPWQDRAEVLASIKYNHIFCHHCGYGERESPNENCQCWNDE